MDVGPALRGIGAMGTPTIRVNGLRSRGNHPNLNARPLPIQFGQGVLRHLPERGTDEER